MRRPGHRTAHPDRVLLCQPVHRIFAAGVCVMVRDQNVRNILIQIRMSDAFGKIKMCAPQSIISRLFTNTAEFLRKKSPLQEISQSAAPVPRNRSRFIFSPFSVLFGLGFADCPHCSIFCFVMQEFFRTFSRSGSFRRKFVRKS